MSYLRKSKFQNIFRGMGSILELFPSEDIKTHLHEDIYQTNSSKRDYLVLLKFSVFSDWDNINKDFNKVLKNAAQTKLRSCESACD